MKLYRKLPYLFVALGVLGLGVSGYLVATHYGKHPIVCGGVGDCNYVNSSEYASIGGIPVSLLGFGMYVMLTAAAVFWTMRPSDERRMVGYWGLALAGAGYAGYLTYVELDILHAICVWCVTSATILTISLALATVALFVTPSDESDEVPVAKDRDRPQASSAESQSSYKRRRLTP